MSVSKGLGLERLRASSISGERQVLFAALAVFWAWLLVRWVYDFTLGRWGVGPGAGENFISPAPVEAVAATLEGSVVALGPVRLPVDWLAALVDGVALAIDIGPALATGAWYTVVITSVAIVLGFFIAVPMAVLRVYGGPFRWVSLAYTELIRGTPLLAQLFVLYYTPYLAIWLNDMETVGQGFVPDYAFWIAIIGFTINGSAYQAEYIRGALESVDEGQLTAARALGLSKLEGIRHVVLPQTLRYAIPAWTNELVYLIKYSSLAGFITVPELYYRASRIASSTFEYTPIFTLLALVYIGIVLSATELMSDVERRVSVPGIGGADGRQQGGTE
ncbi:amino acid ABC transporter permease [Natrarchaeobaculum sulfurireducens]|uniref:ABC-type amino acid transport system, permease component n=1 Tax=Natrarchaeobaculum sulfurireducens TaxID=2044521 RepID=A0A346PLD2_9EURY|nr:amino acid ABC transporter permease [Natrarchaeobaculum sulfurireducens]AXR76657.1 ABC-type amino acid transport system, permease component [Natrarchaeobaculum sulfurireducens]AXR80327.1 Putative transport system permease protein [Natrarchaeobaculum sulfurireducens]